MKILAGILASVMSLSMLATSAFAEPCDDRVGVEVGTTIYTAPPPPPAYVVAPAPVYYNEGYHHSIEARRAEARRLEAIRRAEEWQRREEVRRHEEWRRQEAFRRAEAQRIAMQEQMLRDARRAEWRRHHRHDRERAGLAIDLSLGF